MVKSSATKHNSAMQNFKSDFLKTLQARSYIHQITDAAALDEAASKGIVTAYIGFDATADSLHAGSLVQIMLLRRLQQTGHKPVVLMGGGTTKVGDPSGKDESRQLLTDEKIKANIAGIKEIFKNYLRFDNSPTGAIMVDNAEWLDKLGYISLLREVGPHFTINRMLTFDSVKMRLEREQPLTFLEFNYMIMQAYDFVELFKRHQCNLQMGGSDQWGNIVNGTELGRKTANASLFGLTTPLLTTASGAKMGKTAAGAVWLRADKLSAYDFWQYWRNTEDADVGRFMRLFTDLPLEEIERLEKLPGSEINEAKKILAFEVTKLCHGEAAARQAAETAKTTFEQGGVGENIPRVSMTPAEATSMADVVVKAGMADSKGAAKRLIEDKGVKINDTVVGLADKVPVGEFKLSVGKKRHALVTIG
jgi:tyrosyl-tRNA synthetase